MRNSLVALWVMLILFLFVGCGGDNDLIPNVEHELQDKVVAKEVIDNKLIMTGESVIFSADDSGIKYEWFNETGKLISNEKSFERAFYIEGTYKTILKVTDIQGKVTVSDVSVKVNRDSDTTPLDPDNIPPIAKASISSSEICVGEGIEFFGNESSDSDGSIVAYAWRDMDGILLSTSAIFSRGFPYPAIYHKTLTITDDKGATHAMTVDLVVKVVANAQSVTMDEDTSKAITLAGTDADGDVLTYNIVSNPTNGTLSGTAPNITYTPNANYNGTDSFTFKVNDGIVDSAPATVSITVNAVNDAPIANAGVDQDVDTTDSVTLDGSASSDVDGDPLTYQWIFKSKPELSVTTLSNATVVNPTFTADKEGDYILQLIVNDGTVNSVADSVTVTATTLSICPTLAFNRTIGGNTGDEFYDVTIDSNGNLYVVGRTISTDGDITDGNNGHYDGLLVKFDNNGNKLWDKTIGGSNEDVFKGITIDSSGNLYAAGETESDDGDITDGNTGPFFGTALLVKFDNSGNKLWDRTFGGSIGENFRAVTRDNSDNIYAVGHAASSDIDITDGNNGDGDGLLVKFNSDGNTLWDRTFGGDNTDYFEDITIDSGDNLYVAGYARSDNGDITDGNNGNYDGLLVKFDNDGNTICDKTIGGSATDAFFGIAIDSSDKLYVAGRTESDDGGITDGNNGLRDGLIVKYEP